MDYAVEVCNAVLDVWQPTADNKAIINIPTTVENAMPHTFACQLEYVHKHLKHRENVVLSLHPHNDSCLLYTSTQQYSIVMQFLAFTFIYNFISYI